MEAARALRTPSPRVEKWRGAQYEATNGRENLNPTYEVFHKYSVDLLTVIQDPELLALGLYAENIIPPAVRDAATNTMHEKSKRTSDLLAAVGLKIAVDPEAFDVFVSVLAKPHPLSDLLRRMYGKSTNFTESSLVAVLGVWFFTSTALACFHCQHVVPEV